MSADNWIDEMRHETTQLYLQFAKFTEGCKKTLLEDKTFFTNDLEETKTKIDLLKKKKEELYEKRKEMEERAENEKKEQMEMKENNKILKKQKEELESKKEILKNEMDLSCLRRNELSADVEQIKENKEKEKEHAKAELKFYRDYMGLSMYPIKENQIKFVFSMISKEDLSKEYSVSIDVSNPMKVIECVPSLSKLDEAVSKLKTDGSLIFFLKKVRTLFLELETENMSS